jgi:hypothetical protein
MSFQALFAAWNTRTATPSGWAVLMALAGHHNDETNLCCPSQATLAARTNLSTDTVARAVKDLEAEGLIKRHARRRPDTGARISDHYDLLFASPRQLALILAQRAEEGPTPDLTRSVQEGELAWLASQVQPPLGAGGSNPAQTGLAPPHSAALIRNQIGKKGASRAPGATKAQVDELWGLIPGQRGEGLADLRKRSESKGEVEKALAARLNAGETFERIRDGLRAYYADPDVQREDYRYAKGAQRVIRNGLWQTYLEAMPPEPDLITGAEARAPVDVPRVADWQGRVWLEEFRDNPGSWRGERGPPPCQEGCRVSDALLIEFGHKPNGGLEP